MLDLEKALQDKNTKVILSFVSREESWSVEGINEHDFSIAVASSYDHKDAASSGFVQQKMNAIFNAAGVGQYQLKNIRDTVSEWCGNPKQPLNLAFTLISYDSSVNPLIKAKKLLELSSASADPTGVIKAPGDYSPQTFVWNFVNAPAMGTWTIQIGRWFRATNFLLTNVNIAHSREVLRSTGVPVFVRCSCTFMPYVIPVKEIIRTWYMV